VRQIRSDVAQRYPGIDMPAPEAATDAASAEADARRLSPALDTGIEVQTRTGRAQANSERRQRIGMIATVAVIVALVTAAIGWRYVSDRMAAAAPLTAEASSSTGVGSSTSGATGSGSAKAGASSSALAEATPIFASYNKVKLHLPVPTLKLTEIGFHQASYAWALSMKTPMKDAKLSAIYKSRSTNRDRAAQPSGPNAVMTGQVIRMWRARPGRPDTAADVGALAGTTVLSPVTGTVVRIKPYKLYGKYPDFEMHIIPDGVAHIDIVMIHLTDVSIAVGDRVEAGVTPVAKVRKLSDKFHDQLADYTKSPGDHVHLQVNDSGYKGYKGLVGAVSPSETVSGSTAQPSAGTETDDSSASD
jgi:biotin carboxyl carrier protein